MAAIDIDAIGQRIAAAVDTTKANDPKLLKAAIARLESELHEARSATSIEIVTEYAIDPVVVAAIADWPTR